MKLPHRLVASVLILLLSPMAANAVPITYSWTGLSTNLGSTGTQSTMTAEVVIDSSKFPQIFPSTTPFFSLRAIDFVSWAFTWSDGTELYQASNVAQTLRTNPAILDRISFNGAGVVNGYAFGIMDNGVQVGLLQNSNWWYKGPNQARQIDGTTPYQPVIRTAAAIPLPGTLALLGAGFLALGIRRRQTRTVPRVVAGDSRRLSAILRRPLI